EVPRDVEDYVHRIGRTARAGESGMAISLVAETDQWHFKQIEDFLGKEIYKIPVPANLGEAPIYDPKARPPSENGGFRGKRSSGGGDKHKGRGKQSRPPRRN
ncbi:MAG: ATP-dependent helicase, partial [Prevotellaceae bacterium]|nr:ATP-dependent helicase [Prevotellaceae bacterium]